MSPRSLRLALVLLALVGVLLAPVEVGQAQLASECEPAPVPVRVEAWPNQGARYDDPSFGGTLTHALAAGKRTLFKTYWALKTLPSTCSVTEVDVRFFGGQLELAIAGMAPIPISQLQGPNAPLELPPISSTVGANGDGDPKFDVDGARLNLPAATATVPYTVTLSYRARWKQSGVARVKEGTSVVTSTVTFNRTRPFRFLALPLGDSRDAFSTWHPASADQSLLGAMNAASRMLPVAKGVCSLDPTSAACGVQFSRLQTLLDIGPNGLRLLRFDNRGVQPYCINTGEFAEKIAPAGSKVLLAWNLANPDRQADEAMATIIAEKSCGNPAPQGMAEVVGSQGVTRLVPDTATAPSISGAVWVQESLHKRGMRRSGAPRGEGAHSLDTEADLGTQTGFHTAHNLDSLEYEPGDKSVLRFSDTQWNQKTAGLEPLEWACLVSGRETDGVRACGVLANGQAVGAASGVAPAAAGQEVLYIQGAIGREPEEAQVSSAKVGRGFPTQEDAASVYSAVFTGHGQQSSFRVPVSFRFTHPEGEGNRGTFNAQIPWPTTFQPDRVELRRSAAGSTAVLWFADVTEAPRNVEVRVRPDAFSYRLLDGGGSGPAAVSPSGQQLAVWVRDCVVVTPTGMQLPGGRLVLERLADGVQGESECMAPPPSRPALKPPQGTDSASTQVAYLRDSNVEVRNVTPGADGSTATPAVGPPSPRYRCGPTAGVCEAGQPTDVGITGPATDFGFSLGGDIVLAAQQIGGQNDLAVIPAEAIGVVVPTRMTLTIRTDERSPSFSQKEGQEPMIVFERCEGVCSGTQEDEPGYLYMLDTGEQRRQRRPVTDRDADLGQSSTLTRLGGAAGFRARHPSWGDGFIAAEVREGTGTQIVTVLPEDADAAASKRFVTGTSESGDPGSGTEPSIRQTGQAFGFDSGGRPYLASAAGVRDEVSLVGEDDEGTCLERNDQGACTEHMEDYVNFWSECGLGGERVPIGVGISPIRAGRQLTAHMVVDVSGLCGNAVARGALIDYTSMASNFDDGEPQEFSAPDQPPVAAIRTPGSGSTFSDTSAIRAEAVMRDPETGVESEGSPDGPFSFQWYDTFVRDEHDRDIIDPERRAVGTGGMIVLPPEKDRIGTHVLELWAYKGALPTSCGPPDCSRATVTYEVRRIRPGGFQPTTWNVPSNGTVTSTGTLPSGERATGTRIIAVNGYSLLNETVWRDGKTGQPLVSHPWTGTVTQDSTGVVTSKYSRDTAACGGRIPCRSPNDFFRDNGLVPTGGRVVTLSVEVTTASGRSYVFIDYMRPRLIPA